jgi:Uncharacterized protein conserved in bacteria (DUF2334)
MDMKANKLLVAIISIVLLTTLFAGIVSVSAATKTSTPIAAKSTAANVSASGLKHIVFRDDDVMPFLNLAPFEAVNQVQIDENVPVTLAITPHPDTSLDGNEMLMDTSFLNYLLSIKTNPLFEFAQHGYTHQDDGVGSPLVSGGYYPRSSVTAGQSSVYWHPTADLLAGAALVGSSEFAGRPYEDQYNAIKQGSDDIAEVWGKAPTSFVPPWSVSDANTLLAAHAVGHTFYSTGGDDLSGVSVPGITVQGASLEFPWYDTDWNAWMQSLTSRTDAALDAAGDGTSIVVLYHYWAFAGSDGSTDSSRVAWLEQFIEHLKDRGDVDFTTLNNQNALSVSAATNVTLIASDTNPGVDQDVTFTGNLGVAQAGKPVQIWYVEDLYRSDDATVTTDSKGAFSFTRSWGSTGERLYYATFYGDSDYIQSLSASVNIDVVNKQSTTLTAASTATPSVNQNFTLNGTLKAGTTPIAGATIQLQKNVSGTWTNVAGKTNNTQSDGTYNITTSETTAATYQYRTTYAGDSTYQNTRSSVVTINVKPSTWNLQTVDNSSDVGLYTSLALTSANWPAISYYNQTNGDLKYTYKNAAGWHTQTVDSTGNVGLYTSLALTSANWPAISYYNQTNGDLKYTYKNAAGWHTETVDSTGNVGLYTSLALTATGWPAISYYDQTNGDLKYTYKNAAGWHTETVDSTGNVGLYTSLALTSANWPAISYYNQTNGDLKYTYKDAGGWHTETVDSTGNVGFYTSLQFTSADSPAISYYDQTNGDLKYTYKDAGGWHTETVDSTGNVGLYTSLALTSADSPAISYHDSTNGDLKYAYKDAGGWHTQTVDSTGNVGLYTSLALTATGWPAISYYDQTNGDLKYTYKPPS